MQIQLILALLGKKPLPQNAILSSWKKSYQEGKVETENITLSFLFPAQVIFFF